MTRFEASDLNLRLVVASEEVETYALAALDVLVPAYTKMVYFIRREGDPDYPRIEERAARKGDVRLIPHGVYPRNLGKRFKIIDFRDFLHIAADFDHRVPRSEWKVVRRKIEEKVPEYRMSRRSREK